MYILMYVYVHFNRFKVPCERGGPVTTFPIPKRLDTTMAQEGHSPVLVFDSPVMVLHSLVLVFTQSSFNFYTVQF